MSHNEDAGSDEMTVETTPQPMMDSGELLVRYSYPCMHIISQYSFHSEHGIEYTVGAA